MPPLYQPVSACLHATNPSACLHATNPRACLHATNLPVRASTLPTLVRASTLPSLVHASTLPILVYASTLPTCPCVPPRYQPECVPPCYQPACACLHATNPRARLYCAYQPVRASTLPTLTCASTLPILVYASTLLLLRGYKHDLVVGSIPGPPTPQLWFHPPIKGNPLYIYTLHHLMLGTRGKATRGFKLRWPGDWLMRHRQGGQAIGL